MHFLIEVNNIFKHFTGNVLNDLGRKEYAI